MRNNHYRPDIDGLRAVAVLGVLFYHAGWGFSGGFVGVDVFFVISGFLITGIIARECAEGRFTLRGFWVRRIKRIMPAMAVVVFSVLCAALVLLDPVALVDLGKSAAAQAMIVANIFFLRGEGYFSSAAELKPLLHTWSLAVEEQFYLFFPLVFVVVAKLGRKVLVALLVTVFCISLILGVLGVFGVLKVWRSPNADFYLLPSRAWELLAGSLLALMAPRIKLAAKMAEGVSIAGLILILVPMFAYTGATPFPGLAALPPVLGAVLLILGNGCADTSSGRALSLKPVVVVGLMSYSLYLWHWPLLSLGHHVLAEVKPVHTFALVVLAFVLSFLSWRLVEIPMRSKDRLKGQTVIFVFGATIATAMFAAGVALWKFGGLPSRFDESTAAIIDDAHWYGAEYFEEIGKYSPIGASKEQPDFVLLGDSHGGAVSDLVNKVALERGLGGMTLLTSGRAPVTGLWKPLKSANQMEISTARSRARIDWIIASGVKKVFLVGRWNGMCNGHTPAEIRQSPRQGMAWELVTDSAGTALTPENSTMALRRQLGAMLAELADHGIKVWILKQVPEAPSTQTAKTFMLHYRFPALNGELSPVPVSRQFYEQRREQSEKVFEGLGSPDVVIIDPIEAFFGSADSFPSYGERSHYRDDDHLTRYGADKYLRPLFEEIFTQLDE